MTYKEIQVPSETVRKVYTKVQQELEPLSVIIGVKKDD